MPRYTGENCEGAIDGCLPFCKVFLSFLQKVGNFLSIFIQKAQWIELKRNCIAISYCSQTRAYQQDPETSLTCLRVEHRNETGKKPFINTG